MKAFASLVLLGLAFRTLAAEPMEFAPFMMKPWVTDWAQRVVNNGGPMPTRLEMVTMEAYRVALIDLGLTNSIYTLCIHSITSSVIGASTPLIKNRGSDPWINTGFGATNLNLDGLKGNGTKCLDTGLAASDNNAYSNSFLVGMSMVVTESNSNAPAIDMGSRSADGNSGNLLLLVSSGGTGGRTEFYSAGLDGKQFLITNDFVRVGYISANVRTNAGVTNQTIYIASPLEPHRVFAEEPFVVPQPPGGNIIVWGTKQNGTNNISSGLRIAMSCVHFPWTEVQSSNFWWATKTCLESLGGAAGDPVKDWARRLVELGGPTISITESNAAREYYRIMGDANLIRKTIFSNIYLTNNLFAARTPLLWQAGLQVWANNNFSDTNVSINGLTGNGTSKSLNTTISLSALTGNSFGPITDTSIGVSSLVSVNPASAGSALTGTAGTAASSQFALYASTAGDQGLTFYCYRFINVNTDFLRYPFTTNWIGYLSGNRTAANAIALYGVTNGTHNILTNGTGSTTSTRSTLTNLHVHSIWNLTAPANWSDNTESYNSLHAGYTQTDSSNEWWAVKTARNMIGGGVP